MDSTPSLLTAGLAVFSALLYLLAVWRQVLNLETGEDRQRQQIALVVPRPWPLMRSPLTCRLKRGSRASASIALHR